VENKNQRGIFAIERGPASWFVAQLIFGVLKLPFFVFALPAAIVLELAFCLLWESSRPIFDVILLLLLLCCLVWIYRERCWEWLREGGGLLKIRSKGFPLSTAFSQKVVSLAKGEESGGYRIGKEVDLPLLAFH
jgi:hypothetical protein